MKMRCAIDFTGLDVRTVERASPGGVPTAFRVWRAGQNPTDKGMTVFSPRSAEILMEWQSVRQNLHSIDVDHLSLSPTAPPEARKAVGWHRLDVRPDENGQPELWAVDVEWTDIARIGLQKKPPEWRYFSPAYDIDETTREVVAYLNTALTNNPATWMVSALASRAASEEKQMEKMEDILTALKAMAEGDDEDEARRAKRMVRAAEGDDETPKSDEDKEEEKDAGGEEDDDEKKDTTASVKAASDPVIALAAEVQRLSTAVTSLSTRDERTRLLASRTDLAASVRQWLEGAPVALVRDALRAIPVAAKKDPAAAVKVTATRGEHQGEGRASRLPPDEKRALDEAMGIASRRDSIRRDGTSVVFSVLDREGARRVLAAKKAEA